MFWQLLILQVGFFVLLLVVMQRFFHGHLTRGIHRVEKLQQQNLKKEDELKRYHDAVMKDCEERIRKADDAIRQRLASVEEEARRLKSGILLRAEEEKQGILDEARQKEKILEQRFERESKQKGSQIAVELVRSAFSPSMLQYLHTQLTDELLSEILTSLSGAGGETAKSTKKVRIASAFPFTDKQKEMLKTKLARLRLEKSAEPVFEEQVDKNLVAGFVLYLDEAVLDGSLFNRFQRKLGL